MTNTEYLAGEFSLTASEYDVVVGHDFANEEFSVESFGESDGRYGVGGDASFWEDLESEFFGAVTGMFGDGVVAVEYVFDAFIDH